MKALLALIVISVLNTTTYTLMAPSFWRAFITGALVATAYTVGLFNVGRITRKAPEKRALDYATSLIKSYQLDIKASKWTGVNLVEKGFCQGTVYQDALETIGRIERGELIV